jgi:adenosylcobinamide amidohydrolase
VVSTLEGGRKGIETVGTHYSSPPCWGIGHRLGLRKIRERVYKVIGKSEDTSSFLFTGADMDNLAIKRKRFKEMEVYALVTAGVKSNAVRMSKDQGRFYEPGTINIILLPNMELTPRAMTRAIISATGAKTAALQDLDIRSSYTSLINQATGTGTDNIIVVEGDGKRIDNAGGHSKMGELIAKVVYKAVQEAIYKQNGIVAQRNIFQRLKERKISPFELINLIQLVDMDDRKLFGALEDILLEPRYASFIQASFALSDDYERGLITDLRAYNLWCKQVAEEIAGKKIAVMKDILQTENMLLPLRMALNAVFNGLYYKHN